MTATQAFVDRADIGDVKVAVGLPDDIGDPFGQSAIVRLAAAKLLGGSPSFNGDAGQASGLFNQKSVGGRVRFSVRYRLGVCRMAVERQRSKNFT